MGAKPSLDQLKQVLFQPNPALKKRALAIIFNEAMCEARPLLEEYVGQENNPELQALALKVLNKLETPQQKPQALSPEQLMAALPSATPAKKIELLRALSQCRSPRLAVTIQQLFSQENDPDALLAIAEIFRNNPHIGNLGILMRLSAHQNEKLRLAALESILNVMFGCMYPFILKALLDPSVPLKMKAYQLISTISRANLLEALGYMLENENPQFSRLAGQLLPSFMGPDLIELLKKHLKHPDQETATHCLRTVTLLAQKGFGEAIVLLETLGETRAEAAHRRAAPTIPASLQTMLNGLPSWFSEPLARKPDDIRQLLNGIREVYERCRDFLILSFVCTYITMGKRNMTLDQTVFKVMTQGVSRTDPVALLPALAISFPEAREQGDIFPLVLANRIVYEPDDTLVEDLISLQEGLKLVTDHPEELAKVIEPALQGLEKFLFSLSSMKANRLLVKFNDTEGMKVGDFFQRELATVDPRTVTHLELPLNRPLVVSQTGAYGLAVWPFVVFNPYQKKLLRLDPTEQDLWELLVQHNMLDGFMTHLKQKPAS
ncbi:MAG TPA: hypothetical protein PKO06_17805 [Candidatus Ozemobacteraceae bacterium]|nr:hypothetical protein [Candidatus Ozemobacteraceae bacterium]